MDDELHQYHKSHDNIDTSIQDLLLKLRATQSEASFQGSRYHEMKSVVSRIQHDVQTLWKHIKNPAELKVNNRLCCRSLNTKSFYRET
jgi:peptidoglycan hydrolase CwlO-like protein